MSWNRLLRNLIPCDKYFLYLIYPKYKILMKLYKAFLSTSCILGTGIMMLSLNSCLSDGEESFILEDYVKEIIRVVGIPGDDQAQNSPEVS